MSCDQPKDRPELVLISCDLEAGAPQPEKKEGSDPASQPAKSPNASKAPEKKEDPPYPKHGSSEGKQSSAPAIHMSVGPNTRVEIRCEKEPSPPTLTQQANSAPPSPQPKAGAPSPQPQACAPSPQPQAGAPSPQPQAGAPSPQPQAGAPPPQQQQPSLTVPCQKVVISFTQDGCQVQQQPPGCGSQVQQQPQRGGCQQQRPQDGCPRHQPQGGGGPQQQPQGSQQQQPPQQQPQGCQQQQPQGKACFLKVNLAGCPKKEEDKPPQQNAQEGEKQCKVHKK